MAVISAAIVSAAVISVVVPAAPIRSVVPATVVPAIVAVPWVITVIRRPIIVGAVVARTVENWERNREPESEADTGACRWLKEERQSGECKEEQKELLHKAICANIPRIPEKGSCLRGQSSIGILPVWCVAPPRIQAGSL
jgi:hypothetical protein